MASTDDGGCSSHASHFRKLSSRPSAPQFTKAAANFEELETAWEATAACVSPHAEKIPSAKAARTTAPHLRRPPLIAVADVATNSTAFALPRRTPRRSGGRRRIAGECRLGRIHRNDRRGKLNCRPKR